MIQTINKQCPGDCSKCNFPNEIANFDFYGCVMHNIFQQTHTALRILQDINRKLDAQAGQKVIINHSDDETSYKELPEQEGQK